MREFWREWVINYDFVHQRRLSAVAVSASARAYDRFKLWWHRRYESMLRFARESHGAVEQSPRKYGVIGMSIVCGLMLLFNLPMIVRSLRRRQLARNPAKAPRSAAAIWYLRMTTAMAREGHRKNATDTPLEFVAKIPDVRLRLGVARFTEHYERARFGDSAEDAVKLPEIYEELVSRK